MVREWDERQLQFYNIIAAPSEVPPHIHVMGGGHHQRKWGIEVVRRQK
jgi:hypothetical protein